MCVRVFGGLVVFVCLVNWLCSCVLWVVCVCKFGGLCVRVFGGTCVLVCLVNCFLEGCV